MKQFCTLVKPYFSLKFGRFCSLLEMSEKWKSEDVNCSFFFVVSVRCEMHFSQFRVAFSLKRKKDFEHYISEWYKLLKYDFLEATALFYYVFSLLL